MYFGLMGPHINFYTSLARKILTLKYSCLYLQEKWRRYPKHVGFNIANECAERFSYYGMKGRAFRNNVCVNGTWLQNLRSLNSGYIAVAQGTSKSDFHLHRVNAAKLRTALLHVNIVALGR